MRISHRVTDKFNKNLFGWLLLILVLTTAVYFPLVQNDFLKTWDDNRYILENPHIKALNFDQFITFFTIYFDGHYHPLTLLSLAVDYQIDGLNPIVFHISNLLLHLLNTIMVFWFVYLLLRKRTLVVPLVTSLLFGISTMHVESVAWATERKNVLFAFFYLASLITYLYYVNNKKSIFLLGSMVLFLMSLFSKAMALPLCFMILAIDYFYGRNLLNRNLWLEKVPFFLLAIAFGIVSILAQKSTWGEDLSQVHYTFWERSLFASWAFATYVIKLIVPIKLSGFYPYPASVDNLVILKGLAAVIGIFSILFWFIKTFRKNSFFHFGIIFFCFNIFLLLKLFEVPAGDYILADRYAYIPSIGLYLVVGVYYDRLLQKGLMVKRAVRVIFIILVLFLSIQTLNRVAVFSDDVTFYSNILQNYPNAGVAYTNRGAILKKQGRLNEALKDFNAVIQLGDAGYREYSNRGNTYLEIGEYQKAKSDLQHAVKLNTKSVQVLASFAYAQLQSNDYPGAIKTYDQVIKAQPNFPEAYLNRGTAKFSTGDLNGALEDYSKTIQLDSESVNAYFNRGLIRVNMGELAGAIHDFRQAISLKPDHAQAYSNLGVAYSKRGEMNKAFESYAQAIKIRPNYFDAYLNRGIDYYSDKKFDEALADLNKSISINNRVGASYYFRGLVLLNQHKSAGCEDLHRALQLGFGMASEKIKLYCK